MERNGKWEWKEEVIEKRIINEKCKMMNVKVGLLLS